MTDKEMRDYYAQKGERYTYILSALDDKIEKEVKDLVNKETSFKGDFFPNVMTRVKELDFIRAIITEEIDYCTARVKEYDAEAEKKEEQA